MSQAWPVMSQAWQRTPCRRTPTLVAARCVAAPASCREPPCVVSWCAIALYCSAVSSYRDPKSPPQPRYKSLYCDPAPTRARARPYRRPPARIVAYYFLSWRAPMRCLSALPVVIQFAVLRLKQKQKKQKLGSSPFPVFLYFFFHHFFFIPTTGKPQKKRKKKFFFIF